MGSIWENKTPNITGISLPRKDEFILFATMGCSRVKSLKSRTCLSSKYIKNTLALFHKSRFFCLFSFYLFLLWLCNGNGFFNFFSTLHFSKVSHIISHNPIFKSPSCNSGGFPGSSVVKNSFAMQEMWVQSLGLEDPLEKEMANHSSSLAWKIPLIKDPGGL